MFRVNRDVCVCRVSGVIHVDPGSEGRTKAMHRSGVHNDFSCMNQRIGRLQWSERACDNFKLQMLALKNWVESGMLLPVPEPLLRGTAVALCLMLGYHRLFPRELFPAVIRRLKPLYP